MAEMRVGSPEWNAELDRLGFEAGFRERISKCVENEVEFAGLTPVEALQQGWLDYAEDDGD